MLKINKLYVNNVKIKYHDASFFSMGKPFKPLVFTAVTRCFAVCGNSNGGSCFTEKIVIFAVVKSDYFKYYVLRFKANGDSRLPSS